MKTLSWLLFVFPLVTLIWAWDVVKEAVSIICLKYYCYAFKRSSYLQERCIVDKIYKDYQVKIAETNIEWSSN
jgi:hypothetical protein